MIISGSVTNERWRRAPRPLLLFVLLLFVLLLFVLPRLMASSPLALLTLGGCSTVTALALIKQRNTVGEGESFNGLGVGQIRDPSRPLWKKHEWGSLVFST
jgi:hypothetical protein